MTNCRQCGAEVPQTSKRKRLFCNDKCRMAFKRSNSEQNITPITNKPITNSPKPIANTNSEQTLCKGCQKPVGKLVDICHECIAKGMTRKSLGLPEVKREYFSDKQPSKMNWQRLGLKRDEVKAYIVWSLKKSGILDHSVLSIGDKMFGNYKQQAKELKGNVDEFRKDIA